MKDMNMSAMDSFRKSKEKPKDHVTPPPEGHALDEILKDKNKFHLFSKLLERYGREDLASRLMKGELEENDISRLEEERLRFLEIMARLERVKSLMTEENIAALARKHPDFEKVVNLIRPEKTKRVIQGQLEEMAFTDEYRFDLITNLMENYDSYKNGKYKALNDKVEKMCADGKFTPQEYSDTLAIPDRRKKAAVLKELADRTHGKFKKVINFLMHGKLSRSKVEELETTGILMESSVDELDHYQRDIGSELFLSIDTNEHMRNALARELTDDRTPEETKFGFSDIKREASSIFDEKEEKKAWEVFKKREAYDAAYDYEQDALKDKFIEERKQEHKKKNVKNTGFWASILAALFEGKINNTKDKLK